MATQPHPQPKPEPPKPPPHPDPDDLHDRKAAPAATVPAADPAPIHYKTTQEEQLERQAEVDAAGGTNAWVEAHDERSHEDKQGRTVPGVRNVKAENPR